MPVAVRKSQKADGINKPLEFHKSFLQKKIPTRAIFLLAPTANMLGTSDFLLIA